MPAPVRNNNPIHMLAYGQNCLEELASHIIQEHKDNLPNITNVTILLSSAQASNQLRKLLLNNAQKSGFSALLGPEIETLPNWASRRSYNESPVLTEQQRELMLVEALDNHAYLYGKGSPWTFADSLLELFDELNERQIRLPEKFNDFLQQLGDAYESKQEISNGSVNIETEGLVGEARLVHTLWQAWQQQMQDEGVTDRHTSHLLKLTNSQQHINPDQIFYIAGFSQLSQAETVWLKSFLAHNNASLWLQGSTPPDETIDYHPDCATRLLINSLTEITGETIKFPEVTDNYGLCIDSIFSSTDIALQKRAELFAKDFSSSPVASRLSLFEAKSAEQEALAIDLQTRLWLLEGKHKIGIVTENRRLARRVRALLERAGIELQDAAGWALSTTSAAAILERWLEAVEEDFAYQPLLDLLKSPFFHPKELFTSNDTNQDQNNLLATIYRFEKSVILKENVGSNLKRYHQHTRYRQNRLRQNRQTAELADEYNGIYPLLKVISSAVKPLLPFQESSNGKFSPVKIINALNESLTILGLNSTFLKDDAGRDILNELQHMQTAAASNSIKMSWSDFRGWLGRTLESFNFQPNTHSNHVQLMSLTQSSLCQFDALIIAGAEKEFLPGTINQSPFFNDGVRQSLGLTSQTEKLSQRFYQFRGLLESSPNIVITRCTEQNNEDVVCSPWVERMQSFHTIAYGGNLINKTLTELASRPETIVTNSTAPMPQATPANPVAQIDSSLIPKTISASGYQQLMDCPYQFFAARCLGLEPPETIREMLEKSDYGERVHLCLHAFHSGEKSLPGPYTQPLNKEHREEAILFLHSIAEAVFARDLEDNFLHRGWLKRWQDLIAPYIDWQIERQLTWEVKTTETNIETKLAGEEITLRGRLDRIDASTDRDTDISEISIIDYKTGKVAGEEDVLQGESIQLPFYVLLAEQALQQSASRVEYVTLDENRVQSKTMIEKDTLNELSQQVGSRLAELIDGIQSGEAMTAWGDDKTCKWCQMSGVCRRETWLDSSLPQ